MQLALLRHPGTTLANLDQPVEALVAWMAQRPEIPPEAFARFARRLKRGALAVEATKVVHPGRWDEAVATTHINPTPGSPE